MGIALAAISAITVCFIAYLIFCLRLVSKTGDSQSLVHAGNAIKAFGAAVTEPIFSALASIFRRSG